MRACASVAGSDRRRRTRGTDAGARLETGSLLHARGRPLIETGGFDRDLPRLADVDWIVEAVVEQIDVKQSLIARVDAVRRGATIVSSNTSGIPIASLSAGRSAEFRRHWLGTHFFNPPRYLRLVEVIPTPDTDPAVVDRVSRFADRRLGKGVVVAKDTPNFIANRIGLFGMLRCFARSSRAATPSKRSTR